MEMKNITTALYLAELFMSTQNSSQALNLDLRTQIWPWSRLSSRRTWLWRKQILSRFEFFTCQHLDYLNLWGLQYLRKMLTISWLFLWRLELLRQIILIDFFKPSLSNLLSGVGGSMGLWLGLGILQAFIVHIPLEFHLFIYLLKILPFHSYSIYQALQMASNASKTLIAYCNRGDKGEKV